MPHIDVVDSTWLGVRPAAVAASVADAANWRRWWPGLELRVDEYRGEKGVRWFVRAVAGDGDARLAGTAEVWLQPMYEGVIAHFFLRLDPAPGRRLDRRRRERLTLGHRHRTKRAFWSLADQLDAGRVARHMSASHTSLG